MQLQHISPRPTLKTIIDIIIDTVLTEKIFLLPNQPVLKQLPIPEQLPSYHLLVLTREWEKYNPYELQRKIEGRCGHTEVVNIILHDIYSFNSRLREQQYFFPKLSKSTILYDYGHVPLASRVPMDINLVQRSLQQTFSLLFHKSEQLHKTASQQWKQGVMNVPSLAEVIWHIYTAIEIVFTGHDPDTRDLFRLRQSTSRFSTDIALLFPYHSVKEKQLLTRLHKILMKKPSKEKTPLSPLEYEAILKRAQDVRMMSLLVCQHYINKLC